MARLNFAEEIILLLLDDETGKMESVHPTVMEMLMAGAAMMDLAVRGRIDCDLEKVFVTNDELTGEPMLDLAFEEIRNSSENLHPRQWIQKLSDRGLELRDMALAHLVTRGILREEEKKFLWVFGGRRYPVVDDHEEREVKMRLMDVLLSDTIPDPRDVVLICLADAADVFQVILSPRELRLADKRITQVRQLDLIGQAMSQEIQRTIFDIAVAISQAHQPR
ncbi:MAG: GPP34 family phosphoprotein [Gammaproteobacteria bacterium]|nr:GPP34 family phosphoprotein [Gammaproteobacteria bacterium]MCY4200669.1 GPP34 family phosphoprotein [Gammaproteobacteria bacterium]MCY4278419.1 GPP34 family phosphoprotein [Gammaproteobacteria bacterium]